MSKWEGDKHLQSKYSRVIMETLRILTQKSETRILKCLKEDAERFQGIASYYDLKKVPSRHILVLDFTLPDGKSLRLYARHTPLQSENLNPVTELLQQGISQRKKGERRIPKINNLFTAAFFLYALKFGEVTKRLEGEENKLFPSDSEDESSAEELSVESETQ